MRIRPTRPGSAAWPVCRTTCEEIGKACHASRGTASRTGTRSIRPFTDYVAASAARGIEEERRLAYVALTRARTDLLLTSRVWGSASTPRLPSRFLTELRAAGMADREISWADLPSASSNPPTPDPRLAHDVAVVWPPEPIAGRARVVEAAAQVRAPRRLSNDLASGPDPSVASTAVSAVVQRWDRDVNCCSPSVIDVPGELSRSCCPQHLSTSDLVALATDPRHTPWLCGAHAEPRPPPRPGWGPRSTPGWRRTTRARPSRRGQPARCWRRGAWRARPRTLQANFLASRWAELDPSSWRCRSRPRWRGPPSADASTPSLPTRTTPAAISSSTGRPAALGSGAAGRHRAVQLASYVLAWCRLRGVARQDVRAAFFHAATGETVWPELIDEDGLAAILSAVDPA